MRKRLLLILAIAAAIGFVTSYLVYQVVARVQAGPPSQGTETVVVAAANMSLGETITRQHVRTVSWPKASVPATALRSVDDADGRVVRSSIVSGEPLIEGKLAPRLSGKGGLMAILVPEGQRAVTLKVDDAIRETGFILPNSYIDVLVSMQQPGSGQDRIAKVILQDVQVLASGQTTELRDNKPVTMTTLTLALTPDQTERLTLAQTEGRLFFVTRNLNDKTVVRTRGVTKQSLLSDVAPAPPAPERRAAAPPARRPVATASSPVLPPPVIESVSVSVLRGTKVSEHEFVKKGADQWVEKPAVRQ
jgi:pilus assembly protein CpaB